ncbi:MAG: hypothetical protein GY950_35940, partial [bacterium]|nr:hypothetical protein [bacterium]
MMLRYHLAWIKEFFGKDRSEQSFLYMPSPVAYQFRSINEALPHMELLELLKQKKEFKIKEEIKIKLGTIEIPIEAIIKFLLGIFRIIPIPYRSAYLSSMTHISLVSVKKETQLLVYRKRRGTGLPGSPGVKEAGILALTKEVENLSDFNDLIKDAAFLVLQLNSKSSLWGNGRSVRFFVDGVEALDEYRRTEKKECMEIAENKFSLAAACDESNHDALYFYGSLLLAKRKPESIRGAIRVFRQALETEDEVLKAFVKSGLA